MYVIATVLTGYNSPKFSFSTVPHVHSDYESAYTEAMRLARKEPGKEFAIFEAQNAHKATPIVLPVTSRGL